MNVLVWLPFLLYGYLGIGLVFAILFAFWGVQKIDEGMTSAHWGLRLLLMPGGIALWPILLRKLWKAEKSAGD